jgi:hypothetical protein
VFQRNPGVFTELVLARVAKLNNADVQWAEHVRDLEKKAKVGKAGIVSRPGRRPYKEVDETALGCRFLDLIEAAELRSPSAIFVQLAKEFKISWVTVQRRLEEEHQAWRAWIAYPGKNCERLKKHLMEAEKNPLLLECPRDTVIEVARLFRNGVKPEKVIELLPKGTPAIDPVHIEQIGEAAQCGYLPALLPKQ